MTAFRLPALVERLRRDETGASMIELGLFAPVLGLMLMGISDFAMGYSTKLQVEGAVYRALEKVAIDNVQTDYSYLRAEAAAVDGSGGIQASDVTVDAWLECDQDRQTDFTGTCPAGEARARYVSVTVDWSYTPRFEYGPMVSNSDGVVPVSATASVRVQ